MSGSDSCCVYCEDKIEELPAIQCAQCTDMILCLNCFSCGVEIGQHKKGHSYSISGMLKDGIIRIFNDKSNWTHTDDDNLLDGIESHGLGNWNHVSVYIKNKTAEECERRYYDYFVEGNIGKVTMRRFEAFKNIDDTTKYQTVERKAVVELSESQQRELGYMSLRDDFDREYDSDTELIVRDLSLHYDDESLDHAYKLTHVDLYRHKLRDRVRRKEVAKRHQVFYRATSLGLKAASIAKRKSSREERLFEQTMKKFGRFTSRSELKKLYTNIQRQLKLMKQIRTLKKFSEQGFKSLTGKLKMHAVQMNGVCKSTVKRKKKKKNYYK